MKKVWTREETAVAVKLYCEIPFGKVSKNNIKIIEISRKIGRTPSSLSMKIGNIGRLDPELKIFLLMLRNFWTNALMAV